MKILMSPSKEVNLENMTNNKCQVNTNFFGEKLKHIDQEINLGETKKAIQLYNGIAFRQLEELDSSFYQDVIILSSLYGFSYGHDYISNYRLDYTSKAGRYMSKEFYEEINDALQKEEVIFNLASKEFFQGIIHDNIVNFEFYVKKNGVLKQISTISKKLRGAVVEHIRVNGTNSFESFIGYGFKYNSELSNVNKHVYEQY